MSKGIIVITGSVKRRISAVAIGATTLLVVPATPAMADSKSNIPQGMGYGTVPDSRTRVRACDTNADGWGVRVDYYTTNDRSDSVGDHNGSKGGCGEEGPTGGGKIKWFVACATSPQGTRTSCGPVFMWED